MAGADLIFWVVDATEPEAHPQPGLPESVPLIRIDNKIDLTGETASRRGRHVRLSPTTGEGVDELEALISEEAYRNYKRPFRGISAVSRAAPMRLLTPVAAYSGPHFVEFCPVAAESIRFCRLWPVWARTVLDRAPAMRGLGLVVYYLVI